MKPKTNRRSRGAALLVGVALLLGVTAPVEAQGVAPVSEVEVSYTFGEKITFKGRVAPGASALSINLQIPGDVQSLTADVTPDAAGGFEYAHLISERFVQAFSTVEFRFFATLADGQVVGSDIFTFYYEDNRFGWQVLEAAPFRVHWYAGDAAFAQAVLDAAEFGRTRASDTLGVGGPGLVDIYAYGSLADYQFMRGQLGQLWAGGHADPAAGLIIVSLPPGAEQQLEIERKIPHEVGHLVLYQATGAGFWNLPPWLNEGFASLMETFPNPDYAFLVNAGLADGTLIPLADLCEAFPRDASGALLAYAESASFVGYVLERYGPAGLRTLVEGYAGGAGCEFGPQGPPFNTTLAALESDWQTRLAVPPAPVDVPAPAADLLPWLAITAATLLGPVLLLAGMLFKRREVR